MSGTRVHWIAAILVGVACAGCVSPGHKAASAAEATFTQDRLAHRLYVQSNGGGLDWADLQIRVEEFWFQINYARNRDATDEDRGLTQEFASLAPGPLAQADFIDFCVHGAPVSVRTTIQILHTSTNRTVANVSWDGYDNCDPTANVMPSSPSPSASQPPIDFDISAVGAILTVSRADEGLEWSDLQMWSPNSTATNRLHYHIDGNVTRNDTSLTKDPRVMGTGSVATKEEVRLCTDTQTDDVFEVYIGRVASQGAFFMATFSNTFECWS